MDKQISAAEKSRAVKHYTEQARLAKELNQSQQWDTTMETFKTAIWITNCSGVLLGRAPRLALNDLDMSECLDWAKLKDVAITEKFALEEIVSIATEKVNRVSLTALLHEREELDGRIASMEAMDNE